MKVRSPIVLELLRQGYVRGSRELRNAYARELRKRNPQHAERQRQYNREYAKRRGSSWQRDRIEKWRKENPEAWKKLMKLASQNGLHRRFYERHRERVKAEKREAGKRKRREDPAFGFAKAISDCIAGRITATQLIDHCRNAVARSNAGRDKGGSDA